MAAGVTASTVTTTGDNSVALAVSELPGQRRRYAGCAYNALIAQVGSDVKSATNTQTNSQALVNAVQSQRESVSGVSIDEEMTNLLQLPARLPGGREGVLNTLDSVLNTLIQQV